MKITFVVLLLMLLLTPLSLHFALAEGAPTEASSNFHNESEAGIVITGGNSDTKTFNLKQTNLYNWDSNLLKFSARFLKTDSKSVETAKSWTLGLRYEKELIQNFSAYFGETVESDRFSGYLQRYNTDIGGKYFFYKTDEFQWLSELGYRYSIENRTTGQVKQHYLRLFTEANRAWTKTFSTKFWLEYLPNLSTSRDTQINSEASTSAAISEVFAIKLAYLVKYRNLLVSPATKKTDTQFTTSLVAKF